MLCMRTTRIMNDINMIKLSSQLLFIIPLALGIGISPAFQTAINTKLKTYVAFIAYRPHFFHFGWHDYSCVYGLFSKRGKAKFK